MEGCEDAMDWFKEVRQVTGGMLLVLSDVTSSV